MCKEGSRKTGGGHVIGSVGVKIRERMWEGEGPEVEVKDKDTEVEISGHSMFCSVTAGWVTAPREEVVGWETSRIQTEWLDELHTQTVEFWVTAGSDQ